MANMQITLGRKDDKPIDVTADALYREATKMGVFHTTAAKLIEAIMTAEEESTQAIRINEIGLQALESV